MVKKEQYWAYYDIDSTDIIKTIWNKLEKEVPNHYYKEINPHITVHPRFQSDEGNYEQFKHYVYECFPSRISVLVTDFYYHPREYQPMVICLDVNLSINFSQKQSDLSKMIKNNGGKNVDNPTPPHITLFRSNDKGGDYRKIPTNVNDIRTKCKNLSNDNLPIRINNADLVVEKKI